MEHMVGMWITNHRIEENYDRLDIDSVPIHTWLIHSTQSLVCVYVIEMKEAVLSQEIALIDIPREKKI